MPCYGSYPLSYITREGSSETDQIPISIMVTSLRIIRRRAAKQASGQSIIHEECKIIARFQKPEPK